jgi:hypothetical protein
MREFQMTRYERMTWVGWKVAGMTIDVFASAGCATPDTVMMLNPKTNELARCPAGAQAFLDGRTQADCIAAYQQKGYEPQSGAAAAK